MTCDNGRFVGDKAFLIAVREEDRSRSELCRHGVHGSVLFFKAHTVGERGVILHQVILQGNTM
jgi:hypothetical protein